MFDIRQNCFDEEYGEVNESLVNDYYTALLKAFDESPEGMPFDGNYHWPVSMMDYGFDYLGVSPGQMSVLDFKKILFELFPKKVSVDAERAGEIVAELLAFWQFIARHYPDPNAAAIVEVLGGDCVERLHRFLDDPTNYGMAKSMYMAGEMLGFDMTSQEGLLQYQAAFNGMLEKTRTMAISETEMHYSQKPNSDTLKKMRKDKRKERQAKKKNRARR